MPAEGRLTKKRIDALPLRIMELDCYATANGFGMDGDHAAMLIASSRLSAPSPSCSGWLHQRISSSKT